MDAKTGMSWIYSPPPSRSTTPSHPQNPYLDVSEEQLPTVVYRSRIKPNRVQAIDPEDFLSGKFEDSPAPSQTQTLTKIHRDRDPDVPYQRDEQGEEMNDLARVWKIYNDEAAKFDSSLTEGWNRGIDVLLVFTGLFSAVLTTFVIQSFQMMIPDTGQTTNALLQKLISLQANSGQVIITPSQQSPTTTQVNWVNGIWFAALACSLSTALISMLAKQWLEAYTANMSGSPLQRARQRQSRYMELVSWHVLPLISALPLLLHVALLLFFAGIVVLLWSVDRAATLATLLIVIFAFLFYFASIFLPVVYPECPYQHPISEHLRNLIISFQIPFLPQSTPDTSIQPEEDEFYANIRNAVVHRDDKLDAYALIWLLNTSTDKYITSAALQAIAGLPREFSAIHILHDAGVLALIEHGFQSCFDKDTTFELKWHLMDAEGAWLYCKAWMNMTRGTSKQWPLELLEPLWLLQDLKTHVDGAAVASCAIAVSSVDSHLAQWELLAYLSRYVSGGAQLSQCTVTWILDSMIQGLAQWEMPIAVIEKTTVRAVPVLLRLLRHIEEQPMSSVRSAVGLALYIFTCGPVDLSDYRSEERRRNNHPTVMIKSLAAIVAAPERFGVGELLDIVAKEFSRLASPMVSHSHRFSLELKELSRASLFTLLMSERIAVGLVPDHVFADVLHLLNQNRVPSTYHPAFVKVLVNILLASSHQDVAGWSVRLLRPLLTDCSIAAVQAFMDNSGIHAVLRAAKIGDSENRRLQVDSWRSLCAFVDSSIMLHPGPDVQESGFPARSYVDEIFHSDLLETVCAAIASRRWWLFEVSGRWTATFVELCKLQPHRLIWKKLIKVVRDVNEKGKEHEGMSEILFQLESILYGSPKRSSSELEENDALSTHTVTMIEQRRSLRPVMSSEGISAWFESEPV